MNELAHQLEEIAGRIYAHGDFVFNIQGATTARPVWNDADELLQIARRLRSSHSNMPMSPRPWEV